MKTELNVPYSRQHTDSRLMDWYLPDEPNGAAILWIHGGGWSGGSKEQWRACAQYYADRGYTCASVEYRRPPSVNLHGIVADCRLAMQAFRARADELGFRRDRVAAAGSSAGGHLVAMLATILPDDELGADPELTDRDTMPDLSICYCPVTCMHSMGDVVGYDSPTGRQMLGVSEDLDPADSPEIFRLGSPIDRLRGDERPFLWLTGDADTTVHHHHSTECHRMLLEAGRESRLVILAGVGHGFGYGVESPAQKLSLKQITRFLADYFPA